jgi:hypothetical protein
VQAVIERNPRDELKLPILYESATTPARGPAAWPTSSTHMERRLSV